MRASLLCALCALGAAVPAPIKDTVLTITPPSADRAHDHADGPTHNQAKAALRDLHLSVHMEEAWQGMVGESKTLEQGEADGENHWDKFLDTPVAQEAIKRELDAMGISPE